MKNNDPHDKPWVNTQRPKKITCCFGNKCQMLSSSSGGKISWGSTLKLRGGI
jgi:hypothetical protein